MKRVKQPDEAGVPCELRPLALANLLKELGETKNTSIDVRFVDDDVIANKAASLKQICLPGNNGMDLFDPVTIQPTLSPGRFAHMDDSNNLFTDDSTRLVCHEAFRRVMFLTMQVKNLQDAMSRGTQATTTELAESLNHEEANLLFDRMIAAQSPHCNAASATIRRGMYPNIDELLDKMMGSLILHYRYLMDHCQDYEHFFLAEDATTRKRKAISNAIASKYTKDRTDYLYKWMDDRAHYPYPDANELELLSMGSGLQTNQVNNWATNIRKRKLKASVDLDKKPSDYLDFRFLAEHREKTNQPPQPPRTKEAQLKKPPTRGSKPPARAGVVQGNTTIALTVMIPDYTSSGVHPGLGEFFPAITSEKEKQGSLALVSPARPDMVFSGGEVESVQAATKSLRPSMCVQQLGEVAKSRWAARVITPASRNIIFSIKETLLDSTKAKHIPIFVDKRDGEQKANVADPTSEKEQGDEFEEKLEESNLDSFIEFQNGAEIHLLQLHFEGEYADSTVALDTMTRTSTDHMLCMCDSSDSDLE
jgi:Homeobox KN domain